MKKKGTTTVRSGEDARRKILDGLLECSRAVSKTYGPHGGHVLLQRDAGVLVTKDGSTVAREVSFSDRLRDMGAKLLVESCVRVSERVGDGTTTTSVVLAELARRLHALVVAGCSPTDLVKGVRDAHEEAREVVLSLSRPVTDRNSLMSVALISSNGDEEMSEHIVRAVMAAGENGSVRVEDGYGMGLELEIRDGATFEPGILSPFVFQGMDVSLEQPLVALLDMDLRTFGDVCGVIECASQWPHPLLVFCRSIAAEAMATWQQNKEVNGNKVVFAGVPGHGSKKRWHLDDISSLSGATVVDALIAGSEEDFQSHWLGSVQRASVGSGETTLICYDDDATAQRITSRIASLSTERDASQHPYDKDRISERIARLDGGVCVLRVGGMTDTSRRERMSRVEDCLCSVHAAAKEGVVPGAGAAMLEAAAVVLPRRPTTDCDLGRQSFAYALMSPFRVLESNAGREPEVTLDRVLQECRVQSPWIGWDPVSRVVRDLAEDPMLVDPTAVVLAALEHAVSTATTLVLAEAAVCAR